MINRNESIKSSLYKLTDNQEKMLIELLSLRESESQRLFSNIEMELSENYNPSGNLANKKGAKLSENKEQLRTLAQHLSEAGRIYLEIDNNIINDIETSFNIDIEVITGIEEYLGNNRIYSENSFPRKVKAVEIIGSLIQCISDKIKHIEDCGYTSKYNELMIIKLFKAWWLSEIPHKITYTIEGKFTKYVDISLNYDFATDQKYTLGDYEKELKNNAEKYKKLESIAKAIQRVKKLRQERDISLEDFLQDKSIEYLK